LFSLFYSLLNHSKNPRHFYVHAHYSEYSPFRLLDLRLSSLPSVAGTTSSSTRMSCSWNLFKSEGGIYLVPELSLLVVQQVVDECPKAIKALLLLSKVRVHLPRRPALTLCASSVIPFLTQDIRKVNHPPSLVQRQQTRSHQ
jgi:hypothetical protein